MTRDAFLARLREGLRGLAPAASPSAKWAA